MYKQAQAAGKILHIQAPPANVEPLLNQLDPTRLLLEVHCTSTEEGKELLAQVRGKGVR